MALCWVSFSAFNALLSSHMTNKDDDDDNDDIIQKGAVFFLVRLPSEGARRQTMACDCCFNGDESVADSSSRYKPGT